jgi:hypothetical protein
MHICVQFIAEGEVEPAEGMLLLCEGEKLLLTEFLGVAFAADYFVLHGSELQH